MLQKNDFIEVSYTGKEGDFIFDTTEEGVAKEAGIHNPKAQYKPITICIGQGQILPGIDEELVGKEVGKEYTFNVPAEKAFGKKDAKLVQLVPTNKFKQAKITPQPGLQVDIDGQRGIIKTVSGGRTLVDFNHPLSGKDVEYNLKIVSKIDDVEKKVSSVVSAMLQMPAAKATVKDGKATVEVPFDIVKEVADMFGKKVMEVIPEVKEFELVNPKKDEKKDEATKAPEAEVKAEPAKDDAKKE